MAGVLVLLPLHVHNALLHFLATSFRCLDIQVDSDANGSGSSCSPGSSGDRGEEGVPVDEADELDEVPYLALQDERAKKARRARQRSRAMAQLETERRALNEHRAQLHRLVSRTCRQSR